MAKMHCWEAVTLLQSIYNTIIHNALSSLTHSQPLLCPNIIHFNDYIFKALFFFFLFSVILYLMLMLYCCCCCCCCYAVVVIGLGWCRKIGIVSYVLYVFYALMLPFIFPTYVFAFFGILYFSCFSIHC